MERIENLFESIKKTYDDALQDMQRRRDNTKEVIIKYLHDNGFDGLFCEKPNCGCSIESYSSCILA